MATKFLLANRVRARSDAAAGRRHASDRSTIGSIVEVSADEMWIGVWWDGENLPEEGLVLAELYELA